MNDKFNRLLNELKITDIIFIVYIIIAISGLIANNIEKKSIKEKKIENSTQAHYIRLGIFIMSLLIYIYFVYKAYKKQKINKSNPKVSKKQIFFDNLSLLSTILFFVGGLIILYLEIKNIDEEEIAIE